MPDRGRKSTPWCACWLPWVLALVSAGCDGADAAPSDAGALDASRGDAGARDAGPDSTLADAASLDAPSVLDAAADAGTGCTSTRDRGLWVWGDAPVTTAAERTRLLDFADAHQLGTLYVESEGVLRSDPVALQSLVTSAGERCIGVELLFGNPAWARAAERGALLSLVRDAVTFTASATDRPRAVHLDVEPYALPEWSTDRAGIVRDYYDTLAAVRTALDGSGLELAVDVPFWFDTVMEERGGGPRPLSELVIELVDRAVLMAYRDHAAPPDGIIDICASELAFAQSAGRRIIIGVETLCGLTPETVTFCEEGPTTLEAELATVRATHGADPAFGGFAIHSYDAYRALLGG